MLCSEWTGYPVFSIMEVMLCCEYSALEPSIMEVMLCSEYSA